MKSKLEEITKKRRLIIADIEFEFENDKSVQFVYYDKGHVENGSLRLFVGEEEFLFNPDQAESLREFLLECKE